jgi:hypothetical protein
VQLQVRAAVIVEAAADQTMNFIFQPKMGVAAPSQTHQKATQLVVLKAVSSVAHVSELLTISLFIM